MSNNKWLKELFTKRAAEDAEKFPDWDLAKPLPNLPVPTLERTTEMFLKVIRAIANDEEYAKYEAKTKQFMASDVAKKLQENVLKKAETEKNWAFQWWLEDMYLRNMICLPINSNPGMAFPAEKFNSTDDQLRHAAKLISGICELITAIQKFEFLKKKKS